MSDLSTKRDLTRFNTVGVMAFEGNFYDGHTLADHLEQIQRITGHRPKIALIDRGYRGEKYVENTKIEIPGPGMKKHSYNLKQKTRRKFRQRTGIEPVIGHLKKDHRMLRNYLKGTRGDAIYTMMVVADYNLRHWIIKREKELLFVLFNIIEKWNMVVSLLRSKYRWLALQPIPRNVEKYAFYND